MTWYNIDDNRFLFHDMNEMENEMEEVEKNPSLRAP